MSIALAMLAVIITVPPVIDIPRMVQAIEAVENGDPHALGGKACIKRVAWHDHTDAAYKFSRQPEYASKVYRLRVIYLIEWLPEYGLAATPETIYRAWRLGLDGAARHSKEIDERAARCGNVYYSLALAPSFSLHSQ